MSSAETTAVQPGSDTWRYRERLQTLEPDTFEAFVADLWARDGWTTELTPAGADAGVDVIGRKDGLTDREILIQAKRYTGDTKVGVRDVREYAGVLEREPNADEMVIVTTGDITDPAEAEAAQLNVKLVDGAALATMIAEEGYDGLVDEYAGTPTGIHGVLRSISDSGLGSGLKQIPAARAVGMAAGLWILGLYLGYGVSNGATGVVEYLPPVVLTAAYLFTPYAVFRDVFETQGGGTGGAILWAFFNFLLPGISLLSYLLLRD